MDSEKARLRRARRLEQETLAEIYDLLSPGLYRFAVRQLGDPSRAEDCVADTFRRLLDALRAGGGPRRHLRAYLYRVAHNWITDQYRREFPGPLSQAADVRSDPLHEPSYGAERELERERVRAALARLTPDQRQVIVLKFLEGWSNQEVARSLGKPVGAVKSLQHRALASLKRVLIGKDGKDGNRIEEPRGS